MNPKNIIICILLFYPFFGNVASLQAQTTNTYRISSDSIPRIIHQKFALKGKEIWGIAIPVAMITYGVVSIESDALKNLDYSTRNELIEDNVMWHNGLDNYLQYTFNQTLQVNDLVTQFKGRFCRHSGQKCPQMT
ncbi:hypothetical protein [Viscerimonas tarda]